MRWSLPRSADRLTGLGIPVSPAAAGGGRTCRFSARAPRKAGPTPPRGRARPAGSWNRPLRRRWTERQRGPPPPPRPPLLHGSPMTSTTIASSSAQATTSRPRQPRVHGSGAGPIPFRQTFRDGPPAAPADGPPCLGRTGETSPRPHAWARGRTALNWPLGRSEAMPARAADGVHAD
jgi:hypothetical protein